MAAPRYPRVPVPRDLSGAFDQVVDIQKDINAKKQEIKDLEAKRDFIASVIGSEAGEGVRMERDGYRVTLGARNRLVDREAFKRDYPHEEHPYLYNSPSASTVKIREELPQVEVDKYIERTPSVTVSAPKDLKDPSA